MKKTLCIICSALFLFSCVSAQYYQIIRVEAGTKVSEKFPVSVRYLYPQFVDGQVYMKTGGASPNKLNYNLLLGEIEFINGTDTMILSRKKDLNLIAVAQDTFIYRNGYLKLIHSGTVKVCLSDKIKLKDIVKKGAMGTANRTSSVDSYTILPVDYKLYDVVYAEDLEFQRTLEYYILTASGELIQFRKKNVLELYPEKEAEIQKYLKSNKVNFDKKDDLMRFADFLATL
jgi:hypothetical protein